MEGLLSSLIKAMPSKVSELKIRPEESYRERLDLKRAARRLIRMLARITIYLFEASSASLYH